MTAVPPFLFRRFCLFLYHTHTNRRITSTPTGMKIEKENHLHDVVGAAGRVVPGRRNVLSVAFLQRGGGVCLRCACSDCDSSSCIRRALGLHDRGGGDERGEGQEAGERAENEEEEGTSHSEVAVTEGRSLTLNVN